MYNPILDTFCKFIMSDTDENGGNGSDNDSATSRSQNVNRQRQSDDRAKDVCGHCLKKCTNAGRGSMALECDYCKFWFHAECEGLEDATYKNLVKLAEVVPNLNYYCVFGRCKEVSTEMIKLLRDDI